MIQNELFTLELIGSPDCLWNYRVAATSQTFSLAPPVFEIDGGAHVGIIGPDAEAVTVNRPGGIVETHFVGTLSDLPDVSCTLVCRTAPDSPIVRFHYVLTSKNTHRLTKSTGEDALRYAQIALADLPEVTEVQFAQFNEFVHSFCLAERLVAPGEFANTLACVGPMLVGSDGAHTLLLAYEHGSQVPDAFLHFHLDAARNAELHAVKGNYCDGQEIGPEHSYETLWLQFGAVAGDRATLASAYRAFVLTQMSPNLESRKPYIFYNTWHYQERNKAWYGKPYLESMVQDRILAEIDVAARMGIDVFVLDTGWYEKTGDWRVNRTRFDDDLKTVKAKLDGYGMKLGLWFNPTAASVSSDMAQTHLDCRMSVKGVTPDPWPVWETEASYGMCLVSRYWEAFAEELIRLVRDVGVTYFKWDAIGQYGCDDPGHEHGTAANTERERGDNYAFEQVRAMTRVVDKLCAACPEAIVDFDITEGGRTVGLAFLASGKYFLINNGPYSMNYDRPAPQDGNVNLFFYPGPARGWVCRTPLTYDTWIPTILFLTHYLPDDRYMIHGWSGPKEVTSEVNPWIAIASLVLGQNGIWGDLLSITDAGIACFGTALAKYKEVRDDITAATLVRTGTVGGSPEIYDKVWTETGRGVVSFFASAPGNYTYLTQTPVSSLYWHSPGVSVTQDDKGHAVITAHFEEAGARVIFFGTAR